MPTDITNNLVENVTNTTNGLTAENVATANTINPVIEEEQITHECVRCGDICNDEDVEYIDGRFGYYGEYLCFPCYDIEVENEDEMEEEEEEGIEEEDTLPVLDDVGDCPDLTDEEVVESLQKDMTFGVELEMFGGKINEIKDTCNAFGYTHSGDSSIDGRNAIEIQTKVLKGIIGAKSILKFLKKVQDFGFKVNSSCGTHVHIGATDFFDNDVFKLGTIKDLHNKNQSIAIERGLLLKVTESFGDENAVTTWVNELYLNSKNISGYTSSYRMRDGKISRYSCVPVKTGYYSEYITYVCRNSTLDKLDVTQEELLNGYKVLLIGENKYEDNSVKELPVENVTFFTKKATGKYVFLKTLFLTYLRLEKMLFAMLPEDRQDSGYCIPLRNSYSTRQILRCKSQEDIEKIWYKEMDLREVKNAKLQHYEPSRYHAVNLHAMFYKYGTVEIRTHHGTLQDKSILMWVALHQLILKSVLSGKFDELSHQRDRRFLFTVQEQFNYFIKATGIKGTPLEKFIIHRINKYSPNSLKINTTNN